MYLKNKNIIIILSIYLCITIYMLVKEAVYYTNVLNPIFWVGVLIYLLWDIKKGYGRLSVNKKYYISSTIITLIYIALYFFTGFLFGFTKSPYSHKIISIGKNIISQIIPIISIEMTRLIFIYRNKSNKTFLVITTIALTLLEINYNTLSNLILNKEEFFQYVCSNVLPTIACGMLCSYLVYKGVYVFALIYRIFGRLIILLSPILPNLDWYTLASINILSITIMYLLFKYKLLKEKKDIKKRKQNFLVKFSYIVTLVFSITLVCFMLGVFKYEPISILSNSMAETFVRGDVVIFEKISNKKDIPINSIIIYSFGEKNIAHRVVDKIEENNTVMYQTKGDNNNAPDTNLVSTDKIKGVYVFHIKYIGFPSIWLYDYFNNNVSKVEIK